MSRTKPGGTTDVWEDSVFLDNPLLHLPQCIPKLNGGADLSEDCQRESAGTSRVKPTGGRYMAIRNKRVNTATFSSQDIKLYIQRALTVCSDKALGDLLVVTGASVFSG